MGRISLRALQVRRRAIANLADRFRPPAIWLDAVAEIPPGQIMTRKQPTQHPLIKTRTKTLPRPAAASTKLPPPTNTYTITEPQRHNKRPSRKFRPLPIAYEEDELRRTFYTDHPWELARPRVVLESSGQDAAWTDYSQGVRSANAPLSGESVVQRQLYLLENEPDISEPEAYDRARKEFYDERLKEDVERRVAVEEARAVGAEFGKSLNQKSLEVEDKMYNDWERWSRSRVQEMQQKNAAFVGQAMRGDAEVEDEEDKIEVGVFAGR